MGNHPKEFADAKYRDTPIFSVLYQPGQDQLGFLMFAGTRPVCINQDIGVYRLQERFSILSYREFRSEISIPGRVRPFTVGKRNR